VGCTHCVVEGYCVATQWCKSEQVPHE